MVDTKLVYARKIVVSAMMSSIRKEMVPVPMIVSTLMYSQQRNTCPYCVFSLYRWTSYCQKALWSDFKDHKFNAAAD